MAGYLFSLNNEEALISCINRGVYSTILSAPRNNLWNIAHEGTFADYATMKEGDNVYFFIRRKIYGIGTLININGNCKFLNYPDSNNPTNVEYDAIQETLLFDNGDNSINNRFLCTFIPDPVFFRKGIDMDETLSSSPDKFKILRAFWKLSFIKFSDEENQAFKDVILRRNIEAIGNANTENTYSSSYNEFHTAIAEKTNNNTNYNLDITPFLSSIANISGSIRHEMAVEAALLFQLSIGDNQTIETFGDWDYITHQVIASPFKPIDYMDKMDVFGYKYIESQEPTISHFLVVEIKKGNANANDILQLMKYVDWIKNEYAFGDYSMIKAYMLAFSYSDNLQTQLSNLTTRKFIKSARPPESSEWDNIQLIQYKYNDERGRLDFEVVEAS